MDDIEARNRAAMLSCNTFIAIITPSFIKEEEIWYQPIEASKAGKIMAAFIMEGTEIPDRLKNLNWFKKYYFKTVKDINKISNQFIKDIADSNLDVGVTFLNDGVKKS